MRQSTVGRMQSSALGFGCGSVLGRVGRRASLFAMNAAWDNGITLFDTARSYGFGEAEAVLGEFLQGKRQQAVIATKYGLPPQRQSALKRMALPVMRAVLQVPGVRSALNRGGGASQPVSGEFSGAGLTAAVHESLRQLRTDYLDVLFLHDAPAEVVQRDDVMLGLEALVQSGKILRAGLYGQAATVSEALPSAPPVLTAIQYGANPFDPVVAGLEGQSAPGMHLIANHPFGSGARVAHTAAVLASMASDHLLPLSLREKLRAGDWPMLTEAIFGMALVGADALVLSMMDPRHIAANVSAVDACGFSPEELALMRDRMLRAGPITSS